ncbi:MAG TPA: M23 family metallopeptidase [Usitatibacter sp.]|nr:M23 family metallopeptidase [Usitatibacter sp.]
MSAPFFWLEYQDPAPTRGKAYVVWDLVTRAAFIAFLLAVLGVATWATVLERHAHESQPVVRSETAASPSSPAPLATPAPMPSTRGIAALLMPVVGVRASDVRDSFEDRRGLRRHRALDIMAPRGTPVVAAASGRVARMYRHPLGGLNVYQYDAAQEHALYYAHLDRFAPGLKEGMWLERGELLGYVGSTGNASPTAPHLHFAVFRLKDDKRWYRGVPVNPHPLLAAPSRAR